MTNIEALKGFITEDQILQVLIDYKKRKLQGAETLMTFLFDKWKITTIEAIKIIEKIEKEFEQQNGTTLDK